MVARSNGSGSEIAHWPVLYRLLWRDLWRLRGQALAASLVMACGIASLVGMQGTGASLRAALEIYYTEHRFADIFVTLKRAPESLAQQLAALPGVASVETRIVADVLLDVPGLAEPATGRLISLPAQGEAAHNTLYLRSGRLPEAETNAARVDNEIVISESFASAHRLRLGDPIGAILNGRARTLRVVGIALSPEYIYELPPGGMLPDNLRFGVFWMRRPALAAAFDLEGAFNSVSLRLLRAASSAEVIRRVDLLLTPYGGLGAYNRNDQLSHRFISDELRQIRITSTLFPSVFFGVAAFLLHMVFSRLVNLQRAEIGLLKAFGYSNRAIGAHYLRLSCAAVSFGIALGVLGGLRLGQGFIAQYHDFYRFPALQFHAEPRVLVLAVLLGIVAATLGAWNAVYAAVRLPPAEAMRPPPPAKFRLGLLERFGLMHSFTPAARMVWRNLARRPWKATLSVLGVACAMALLVAGGYSLDAIRHMIRLQFEVVQREDAMLVFNTPRSADIRFALAHLPGVLRVETFRSVGIRLRAAHRTQRVALLGLSADADLRRLIDAQEHGITLPPDGLVLTRQLAQTLQVRPGDTLTLEVLEGTRPVRQVTLAAVSDELLGVGASMNVDALNRLLGEGATVSGAFLAVDATQAETLYERLKHLPVVASVIVRGPMLQSVNEMLKRTIIGPAIINVMFACVIAFGVVYNGVRIALSERGHELASLRVLGFTQREVGWILLGEQALLILLALPLGAALGWALCAWFSHAMSSDLFRMPLLITPSTYAFALLVVLLAAATSGILVARRLATLDLVAVLKTRE